MEEKKKEDELIVLEGMVEQLNPAEQTEPVEDGIFIPEPDVQPIKFNPFVRVPAAKQKSLDYEKRRKARRKAQKRSRKINRKHR